MTTNNEPTVEQIADIVREHLAAAYVCNRVWEAWSYNTMGPDDFIEASETEMADEIAAAVFERYSQPAASADEWLSELAHLLGRYGLPPEHLEPVLAHARKRTAMPADAELLQVDLAAAQATISHLSNLADRWLALRDVPDDLLGFAGIPCVAMPEGPKAGKYLNGADADAAVDGLIARRRTGRESDA